MRRLLLVFCLFFLSGCGAIALSQVRLEQSLQARQAPAAGAQADVPAFTAGAQAFATDLYRQLSRQPGNLLFSPHSLYLNLVMDYAGARAETARQMAQVLHIALPAERLHAAANALEQDLSAAGAAQGGFQLAVANGLWAQQGEAFSADYLDLLARWYGSGARRVDYTQDAARQQAVLAINQWASDQTRGKITNLVADSALNERTRLVLVSSAYFKAEWQERFEPLGSASFTLADGQSVSAAFITSQRHNPDGSSMKTGRYPLAVKDGLNLVEIPYKGGRASFVALMPTPGNSLAALEASLTPEKLHELLAAPAGPYPVWVEMPKFGFTIPLELSSSLVALGMPDAFNELRADFSGMNGKRDLRISSVAQKNYIQVNELGTEAASASFTGMVQVVAPIKIRLDHPFLFLILDRPSGAILFLGRVSDPR